MTYLSGQDYIRGGLCTNLDAANKVKAWARGARYSTVLPSSTHCELVGRSGLQQKESINRPANSHSLPVRLEVLGVSQCTVSLAHGPDTYKGVWSKGCGQKGSLLPLTAYHDS